MLHFHPSFHFHFHFHFHFSFSFDRHSLSLIHDDKLGSLDIIHTHRSLIKLRQSKALSEHTPSLCWTIILASLALDMTTQMLLSSAGVHDRSRADVSQI